jgi:hypothetical protein
MAPESRRPPRQGVHFPGMTGVSQQDIRELVRRLETDRYALGDIREAGELLGSALARDEAYRLGLEFWESAHGQVRALGLFIMQALAPDHEGARGFVAGAKHASGLPEEKKAPDYSAIGEVIKHWMREYRNQRKGVR